MMVESELLQLERIGKIAINETKYFELIDRKPVFSACAPSRSHQRRAEDRWNPARRLR
jgi:hypothetical protein